MVTQRPLMLIAVSWSPKMTVDTKITATSLKMPATELLGRKNQLHRQTGPDRRT